jgi:light-regulated signal transduction histidine kinase (bacteriophytochrome)
VTTRDASNQTFYLSANEKVRMTPVPNGQACPKCASVQAECEALRQKLERNQAELDTFVYRVSHDLKAPVVSLYGMASIVSEDYGEKLGEQGKYYLGRLMANAGFVERLIADLLSYSRVGRRESKPEQLQSDAVVQGVLGQFSKEIEERKIRVKVRSPLPALFFDQTRLEQLFSHLISNAIRFMGDQPNPIIEIGCAETDAGVTFYVRDNGIGIDPQYHEIIFGVFERLKEIETEGTGMGLALVRKILDLAGGKIWIESKKGEGATFSFSLPKQGISGRGKGSGREGGSGAA